MGVLLDCEAYVRRGMDEGLLKYLASPGGNRALECAKAMHKTELARMKEVLKAYNLADLYAAMCVAYPAATLHDLCRILSSESANLTKKAIEQFIETSMPKLLGLLTTCQRKRFAALVSDTRSGMPASAGEPLDR